MEQYVGTSNRILSAHEAREAVSRWASLPSAWSPNQRDEHVASEMTGSTAPGVFRNVSPIQVYRARHRQSATGDARCERHRTMKVAPTVRKHRKRSSRAMPTETRNLIVQLVLETCYITAPQLRDEIHHLTGETWAPSTIAEARRNAGLTRKRTTARKKDACPVQQHNHAEALIQQGYQPEHFVFIDGKCSAATTICIAEQTAARADDTVAGCAETHKAARDWYPQYGYAKSGCPAYVELEGPINISFSTLAAMTLDGIIGWKTTAYHGGHGDIHGRRGQDTACFIDSFCDAVLPYLRPFPEPCSVVILDNSTCVRGIEPVTPTIGADPHGCDRLHHDDQGTLEALVEMAGAKLHFLPTYSPQLNPIELAFGSVLAYLRAHSNDPRYLLDDGYYDLLDDAFRSIDYRKASSFISHMYTELAKVHCPGPAL